MSTVERVREHVAPADVRQLVGDYGLELGRRSAVTSAVLIASEELRAAASDHERARKAVVDQVSLGGRTPRRGSDTVGRRAEQGSSTSANGRAPSIPSSARSPAA